MPEQKKSTSLSLSDRVSSAVKSVKDWNEQSRQRAQALKPILDRRDSLNTPVRQVSTAYKYWRGKLRGNGKGRTSGR